jgi:hypothetical protein
MNFIKSSLLFSLLIIFGALVLSPEKAAAQTDKYWSLGLKLNPSLNKFRGLPGESPNRLGYSGGMIINKSYTPRFSMQMELLFSRENYFFSGDSLESNPINNGSGTYRAHEYFYVGSYDYSYVRIPLMGKFSFSFTPRGVYPYYSKKERSGIDIYFGGFWGYNLSQRVSGTFRDEDTKYTDDTTDADYPDSTFITTTVKYLELVGDTANNPLVAVPVYKMDFGPVFGLGFTYYVSKKTKFSIDVRYAIGLANLDLHGHFSGHNRKLPIDPPLGEVLDPNTNRSKRLLDVHTSSLQFSIGFIHRLGRDY